MGSVWRREITSLGKREIMALLAAGIFRFVLFCFILLLCLMGSVWRREITSLGKREIMALPFVGFFNNKRHPRIRLIILICINVFNLCKPVTYILTTTFFISLLSYRVIEHTTLISSMPLFITST